MRLAALILNHARPTPVVERPSATELFRDHARYVWRVVAGCGVAPADVQDVTQEVFIIATRKLDEWDPARGAVTTWLYGIAARVAANHRPSAYVRRERSVGDVSRHLPDGSADPALAIDRERLLKQLDLALATLDEPKRQVFVLFEIAELSMHEVAAALGCPLKTAYKRLYAARREIAAHMRRGTPLTTTDATREQGG